MGAETPSVPGRHGTSSLPTWPPRRLCHWRRIAAVGIAAPPPPAAPLETPPAASARPAALDVSRRTARTGCRQNNHQKHTLGKLWTNTLRILILKTVIRSTRVLFSLNHLGMNLLCERFIKSFLLFFLSILLYFFLSLSFSWPRRVKSWKLGENKKLFKIPSELLSNALMAATKLSSSRIWIRIRMAHGYMSSSIQSSTGKRTAVLAWAVCSERYLQSCLPLVVLLWRGFRSWQEAVNHKKSLITSRCQYSAAGSENITWAQ